MSNRTASRRLSTVVVVLALGLAACGNSIVDDDASGASVFCGSVIELFALEGQGSSSEPDADDFDRMADISARVVDTMPEDTPRDVSDVLEAMDALAQLGSKYDGNMNEASVNEVLEAGSHGDVLSNAGDTTQVWLSARCPGVNLGILGDGTSPTSDVAAEQEPEVEPTVTPTPLPTPTPEPTPVPIESRVVVEDGDLDLYQGATMDLGKVTVTNGTVDTYFGLDKADAGFDQLFAEIRVQTAGWNIALDPRHFQLATADSGRVAAEDLYSQNGQRQYSTRLDEADSADLVVRFELPPEASLEGAYILYANGAVTPAVLPLDGSIGLAYPMVLEVPPASMIVPVSIDEEEFVCSHFAEVEITSAQIGHEKIRFRAERLGSGDRGLVFDFDLAHAGKQAEQCREPIVVRIDRSLALLVDGARQSPDDWRGSDGHLWADQATQTTLSFTVPADASELTLVSGQALIARWVVEMPPAFEEPDWSRAVAPGSGELVEHATSTALVEAEVVDVPSASIGSADDLTEDTDLRVRLAFDGDNFFESGSAVLNDDGVKALGRWVELAGDLPAGTAVAIDGWVDEVGAADFNEDLAWNRARSALKYLEAARPDFAYSARGHGIDDLLDPECRGDCPANRTVTIQVTD